MTLQTPTRNRAVAAEFALTINVGKLTLNFAEDFGFFA
jgi:hypothetical protein